MVSTIKTDGSDGATPLDARGLCINCDDNIICKFPGHGRHVLFCEEHDQGVFDEQPRRCSQPLGKRG